MEGKLPPQDIEVESYIISVLLNYGDSMDIASDLLTPEMFYKHDHVAIYRACYEMYSTNTPIDLITVTSHLRKSGTLEEVGGTYAIMQISQKSVLPHNLTNYCLIIKEKYILRELARLSNQILRGAYEDKANPFELISEAEKGIFSISNGFVVRKESHIGDAYRQQIKNIEAVKDGGKLGYMSYIQAIDNITHGFKPQNLVIIAARPGMGKTSLGMTIARNMAVIGNIPVGFFSMEMSTEELTAKFTSLNSNIPLNFLVNHTVHGSMFTKMMDAVPQVNQTPLYINDAPALTVMQLRSNARKMCIKYGVKVIFVDYLGLMKAEGKNQNRTNDIGEISRGLKAISKELNIVLIALAQLNRAAEGRDSKKPELRDLRDSGDIEQDADVVIFPFRPDYYQPNTELECEILVRKHRNGALGDAPIKFVKEFTRFEDVGTNVEYAVYGEDVTNKDLGLTDNPF